MVDAVRRRDMQSAVDLLTEHINGTTRVLLKARIDGRALLPRDEQVA
jgi:DNA-binding GntR family transcriptional regulator